jgi:WXG100 family type VII secretion target
MSGNLVVNHAVLVETVATMHRAVAVTEARLDQLRHELAPLEGEWFGQAQAAWRIAQDRWSVAETEMHHVLADLGARLGAAQEAYLDADRAGARAFE